MNIIQDGDHVVLMIPQGHASQNDHDQFAKMHAGIPEALAKVPVAFTLTSLAIGAVGSSPQVLFVVRKGQRLLTSDSQG